jgi:hypothetical protein
MTAPLTAYQANAVYDVLVQHASADEDGRDDFAVAQMRGQVDEYRFVGSLGFGGKFWNCNDRWYVTCYAEDLTAAGQAAVDATNTALDALRQSVRS